MGTKNIAIVVAPNMRFVNTGMTTVELAAKCFFENIDKNVEITFYSLIPPNPKDSKKWMMMDLGYVHHSAKGIGELFNHKPIFGNIDNLFSNDMIIYWGDFLQAKHYIESEGAGRLSQLYKIEKDKSLAFAYHALLQSEESDRVKVKSIIFGSSLLYNCVGDYINGRYSKHLVKLLGKSRLVLMRDPISAVRISNLTQDYSKSHLGIDPAFLLKENDFKQLPVSNWSNNLKSKSAMGLFFGTRTEPPKRLFEFCRNLGKHFNVELEWVPWFPFHEKLRQENKRTSRLSFRFNKNNLLDQIENCLPRGDQYTQGDLLSVLKKYSFVVTDTYHLCINSWIAGTPAICFGSERKPANKVIKDFKKRILYEMFDAKEFYFDVDSLETKKGQLETEKRIINLLSNPDQSLSVKTRMVGQASSVRRKLIEAINEILE